MRIDGWNWVPRGYGLAGDLSRAPWWLRLWFATPFIDRFAHPVVIRCGYAWLVPHPGWFDDHGVAPPGWIVRQEEPAGHALFTRNIRTWTRRSRLLRWFRLPHAVTLPGGIGSSATRTCSGESGYRCGWPSRDPVRCCWAGSDCCSVSPPPW